MDLKEQVAFLPPEMPWWTRLVSSRARFFHRKRERMIDDMVWDSMVEMMKEAKKKP